MYLAYYDESGDDGYPSMSSPIFVLSAVYIHNKDWKDNYLRIYNFRRSLRTKYGLPVKLEFHTRNFIQDKNPYHGLYTPQVRHSIISEFFTFINTLNIRIINVAINKSKITATSYAVLENALKYSIQRIENDMRFSLLKKNFIIITDEGRIDKMTRTTRAIQRINYIPSHFGPAPYKNDIKFLLEDPLPKKSQNSYFIQICDLLSYIVNLYVQRKYCYPQKTWPNRVLNVLSYGEEEILLNSIKNVLNLKASGNDPYGLVCYPK